MHGEYNGQAEGRKHRPVGNAVGVNLQSGRLTSHGAGKALPGLELGRGVYSPSHPVTSHSYLPLPSSKPSRFDWPPMGAH